MLPAQGTSNVLASRQLAFPRAKLFAPLGSDDSPRRRQRSDPVVKNNTDLQKYTWLFKYDDRSMLTSWIIFSLSRRSAFAVLTILGTPCREGSEFRELNRLL